MELLFNFLPIVVIIGVVGLIGFLAMLWRRVVPPNEVHIVNRRKTSTSYGNDQEAGNVYWDIPSWIPVIGNQEIRLSTTVFDIQLDGYPAYDIGKVPFAVDVISFFQIGDPVQSSKRIESMGELEEQLKDTLRGAVRKILSGKEINEIMQARADLAQEFQAEVTRQVSAWGVEALNIEFTDIRDAGGSQVVTDIMEKKRSKIEMERRTEVAENMKTAKVSEIENQKQADLQAVIADEEVQTRDAEREQKVGVAMQRANQQVQEETRKTKEKEVAVQKAEEVGRAQYEKEQTIIQSEAAAEQQRINAEGERKATEERAQGVAKAITLEGNADADIIKKKAVAEAEGEMERAKAMQEMQKAIEVELGRDAINAQKEVGIAIAKAYEAADIKAYLSNGEGISGLKDLLTTGGGQKLASFLDTFKDVTGGKGLEDILKNSGLAIKKDDTPPAEKPPANT